MAIAIAFIYAGAVSCSMKTIDSETNKAPAANELVSKKEKVSPGGSGLLSQETPSSFEEETLSWENSFQSDGLEEIITKDESQLEKSNPFFDPQPSELSRKDPAISFRSNENLENVFFGFDQYNIDDSAKQVLLKNSEWMKKNPSAIVQLQGHCDERGTNNYNIALGQRRARHVKRQLINFGIKKDRLLTISYGEEKPVCLEGRENCWRKNRRVQFLVSQD